MAASGRSRPTLRANPGIQPFTDAILLLVLVLVVASVRVSAPGAESTGDGSPWIGDLQAATRAQPARLDADTLAMDVRPASPGRSAAPEVRTLSFAIGGVGAPFPAKLELELRDLSKLSDLPERSDPTDLAERSVFKPCVS